MKVLFVSSGNRNGGISPLIYNQGRSLLNCGIRVDFFKIKKNGLLGYIAYIKKLKRHLEENKYDLIHAHYLFSGIVSGLATNIPVVVSLMGSDVLNKKLWRILLPACNKFLWKEIIVKSDAISNKLKLNIRHIIPNGVNIDKFCIIDKEQAREKVHFDQNKKHVLFAANPDRKEKNILLAREAIELLNDNNVKLNIVYNVEHDMIPYYMNASDVLLLTSYYEGSSNVVKEALACNLPVVATEVGDVKKWIENIKGCYITSFDKADVMSKLKKALYEDIIIESRQKIIQYLDENKIAIRISQVYQQVLAG